MVRGLHHRVLYAARWPLLGDGWLSNRVALCAIYITVDGCPSFDGSHRALCSTLWCKLHTIEDPGSR